MSLPAVSPLCLGTNVFGWTATESASHAVLDAFVTGGGNFIDTADGYLEGPNDGNESERIIGTWLAGRHDRESLVVATKCGMHSRRKGLSAETVRTAAMGSIDRLGGEPLDLLYAHFDDEDTPLDETFGAFDALIREGLVKTYGLSNYTPDRLREALAVIDREGYTKPVALQPDYSLMERDFEEEKQAIAAEHDLAVFPYFSLAAGFLTGKYRPGGHEGDSPRAGKAGAYLESERGPKVLEVLDTIAADHAVAVATVALAWLRAQPTVAAPIASARDVDQLGALLASISLDLNENEVEALTEASG